MNVDTGRTKPKKRYDQSHPESSDKTLTSSRALPSAKNEAVDELVSTASDDEQHWRQFPKREPSNSPGHHSASGSLFADSNDVQRNAESFANNLQQSLTTNSYPCARYVHASSVFHPVGTTTSTITEYSLQSHTVSSGDKLNRGEDAWPRNHPMTYPMTHVPFSHGNQPVYGNNMAKGYPYPHPYPLIEKHGQVETGPSAPSHGINEPGPINLEEPWYLYENYDPYPLI
jgi:hypothetical protein